MGDSDYEWDSQYKYGSWGNDWILAEGDERTLAVVTNPFVMGKYVEAQQELGIIGSEVTPELILDAVLESVAQHEERNHGTVPAETIAYVVFGIKDPRDSTYEWVLDYLNRLSEIKKGIRTDGRNRYQALPPEQPEAQQLTIRLEGPAQPQTAEDVERLIRQSLGGRKPRRR